MVKDETPPDQAEKQLQQHNRNPLNRSSAVSQKSVELSFEGSAASSGGNPLNKSKLATQRSVPDAATVTVATTTTTSGRRTTDLRRSKNPSIESTVSLPSQKSLDKHHQRHQQHQLQHQKSTMSGGAQSDVVLHAQHSISDDRKALRDALYQGIFSRHRRTIFAVGSFLRMLRTKNSNYDSIRSDSEDV